MAKKRKNDTRIDPFAAPLDSSSSLDALLNDANAGDVISMPSPSDPDRMIRLHCEVIPHHQIRSKTSVFGKNRREQSLLTEKSVADILPSIKEDKKNLHPALCWEKDGQLVVLAGSRRRKACLLAKADYLVLHSQDFTEQDAKTLAVSSDQYIAPSLWELGKAYKETKQELIDKGLKGSYREIAQLEGVSHTAIADSLKAYETIPREVLLAYPTANHLGREAAKKLINALKEDESKVLEKLAQLPQQPISHQDHSDEKRAILITQYLTQVDAEATRPRAESVYENDFVKLQRNIKNGDITIKIDNKVMTDKRLEQLQKLLSAYN